MPENWPRGRSGYWPSGTSGRRDPVRGFPPTPGSRAPEYPSTTVSGANGTGGSHHGASTGRVDHADGGTPVLTAVTADEADRGSGPPAPAWSTQWGAGPWVPGAGGAAWASGIMAAAGIKGVAGTGSQTWTYGEDDPTEIWTLRRPDDGPDQPSSSARPAATQPAGAPEWAVGKAAHSRSGEIPATPRRRQPGHRGRPRARASRMRVMVAVAAAVAGATAVAAAGAYALSKNGHSAASAATPAHAAVAAPSASPSATLGKWQHISSRTDDPIPLSLAELYPSRAPAGPQGYLRTAQRVTQRCWQAVFGSKLKAAVRNGCSQALRASYLSGNGKQMGTIGVLNLPTADAAAKIGKVVAAPRQFIQPLPASSGATKNLGKGTGVVWAVAKGHYLILMWAQYANLHSPVTKHDRQVLMQFVNNLYQQTVNQSLTRRMVTGTPLTR